MFPHRLVPEERISFGINPAISTLTTVMQIREDYNEVDCRAIAKEVRRVQTEFMFAAMTHAHLFLRFADGDNIPRSN